MAIKLEIKIFIKYLVSIHSELSNISNKDFQKNKFWKKLGYRLALKTPVWPLKKARYLSSWDYPVRKSTMVRLLNRLIEPTRGQVLIDGVDIAKISDAELRECAEKRLRWSSSPLP